MAYYQARGDIPPTRHTQHRDASGQLLFEELMGADGFSADSALLYHRGIPSALTSARPWRLPDQSITANEPLLPRHLKVPDLFRGSDTGRTDLVTGRRLLLGNTDVRISYVVGAAASPLYRNAVGDECLYIEAGSGVLETVFGPLSFGAGDFVLLPRGTTHQWRPQGAVRAYVIEANSHIAPPRRYRSPTGQLLEHAPYCERDLHGPADPVVVIERDVEVFVRHRVAGGDGIAGTVHVMPHHPFDVVGWDGCLYPYRFNVSDFMPLTGKVHQPPPVHQVFEGGNFAICAFVPRKVDYHELAVAAPYYHANVDSDEVMFYCGGDYAAREGSGIGPGSVSLHPGGHVHGPHPGAVERSIGTRYVDELAVMVDTFRPLGLGEGARACDDGRYAWTWSAAGERGRP